MAGKTQPRCCTPAQADENLPMLGGRLSFMNGDRRRLTQPDNPWPQAASGKLQQKLGQYEAAKELGVEHVSFKLAHEVPL